LTAGDVSERASVLLKVEKCEWWKNLRIGWWFKDATKNILRELFCEHYTLFRCVF